MEETKPEARGFKPRFSHLYPVILSLGITGVLGYPLLSPAVEVTPVEPFQGNTFSGASLNALYFVAALGISATLMLFLVRSGKLGVLRRLVKVDVVIVCFTVALWYSGVVFSLLGLSLDDAITFDILLAESLAVAWYWASWFLGEARRA